MPNLISLATFLPPHQVLACRDPYVCLLKYIIYKVVTNKRHRKPLQAYFDEVCMGTNRMNPLKQ